MEHQINDIHDLYEGDEKLQFLQEFGQNSKQFYLICIEA
jgi:hypothetical protein